MSLVQLRKAVLPVAGLGRRFLSATKAMAKAMLPVVDKPLIQYAVEEARAAGIEQFCMITGRGKMALVEHFDVAYDLEATLKELGKNDALAMLRGQQMPPDSVDRVAAGAAGPGARDLVHARVRRRRPVRNHSASSRRNSPSR